MSKNVEQGQKMFAESKRRIHVAVGVILDVDRRILIAKRAEHLHQGGLWEFPGGKVDPGETVLAALARELEEELGIRVEQASPLMEIHHDYTDRSVFLDVWTVPSFHGEPTGREGQPLRWVTPKQLDATEFPDANAPIVERIRAEFSHHP